MTKTTKTRRNRRPAAYWDSFTAAELAAEILRLRDVVNSPASGRLAVEHAANLLVEMRRDLARKES